MSQQISPNTITGTSSMTTNAKPVILDMTMEEGPASSQQPMTPPLFTQAYDSEEDTTKDTVEDNDEAMETANDDGRKTPMPAIDDSAKSSEVMLCLY